MKQIHTCVTSIMLLLTASLAAAADTDALIENCNDCHGDNGVSRWTDVPTIAGLDEFVSSEALFIYRDNARPCSDSEYRQRDTSRPAANMCGITQDLSDEEIEALAAAYAALPYVPAKQEFDTGLAATGQEIHDENCGVCHSDGGSNPADESSILAGQWMGYLEQSFKEYRSGERDQSAKMREKMDALSEDDITSLLHYYASQQ